MTALRVTLRRVTQVGSQKSEVRSHTTPLPPKGTGPPVQLRRDLLEVVAQLEKLEGQPDREIVKRITAVNSDGSGARKLSVDALLLYCAKKGSYEWAEMALDNGRSWLTEIERERCQKADRAQEPVDLGRRFPDEPPS